MARVGRGGGGRGGSYQGWDGDAGVGLDGQGNKRDRRSRLGSFLMLKRRVTFLMAFMVGEGLWVGGACPARCVDREEEDGYRSGR